MTTYLRGNKASLYLGLLLCTGQTTDAAGNVFTIKAQAAGASWGSAQPIDVAVQRWMTDGAIAATQGYENRTISFQVKISAATSVALAAGETALVAAATGATTVSWVPPEGSAAAATTVFDVWTTHLEHQLDIDDENRLTRLYTVTATAKPWARSLNLTTSVAVPTAGTPVVTSVDTCTSLTGWTGSPSAPTLVSSTTIRESKAESGGTFPRTITRTLTRTGSVTGMGTTPYLVLDTGANPTGVEFGGPTLSVTVDGQACAKVSQIGSISYWQVPVSVTSFTVLKITATFTAIYAYTYRLDVNDVSKTDKIGVSGTHKMLSRHLDVGGAVKTSGSLQIASPSATVLGDTIVYTCPDIGNGYTPPLRGFRTAGGVVSSDGTAVSGSTETFITSGGASVATINYSIPGSTLREGTYVVIAKIVIQTNAGTVAFTYGGGINGVSNVPPVSQTTGSIPLTGQDVTGLGAAWVVIGTIDLPTYSRPGESVQDQRFFLAGTSSGNGLAISLDEVFLFDVTNGALTFVQGFGSSGPPAQFTQLWLDSPDYGATNRPQVYIGNTADRSDSFSIPYGQVVSLGDHDLDPGGTMIFTVTEHVADAVVTASYYQRWHTHAAA